MIGLDASPAVLDGHRATPPAAEPCAKHVPSRVEGGGGYRRTCPECSIGFLAGQPGQLFCCVAHKRVYNNRWLKRGAVLAPIYAAARATRGGTRGPKKATGRQMRAKADQLVQQWRDEDKAASRMSAIDYMDLRDRLGMVEIVR